MTKKQSYCVYYCEIVRSLADNTSPFNGHFLVYFSPVVGFFYGVVMNTKELEIWNSFHNGRWTKTELQRKYNLTTYQLNKILKLNPKQKKRKPQCPKMRAHWNKKYRERGKKFIDSHKKPCVICGESDLIVIDFHHMHTTQKEYTISKMCGMALEKIALEINKCVCLCANCHRKVHAGTIDPRW